MDENIKRALVDEEAMSRLLNTLEPFVFRVAYHLTRHQQDAEDLAQDVLYKICTRLNSYRGESALQTWVYQMTINAHRDMLRRKKSRDVVPLEAQSEQVAILSSFEREADTRIVFHNMLQTLPDVDQQIVILRFQNDLPVRDVAQILNLSESNIKTRVFRLKDQLRKLFLRGGEVR